MVFIFAVHGGWNDWSLWTPCSVSCGEGVKIRRRECNAPPPANGGRNCEGGEEEWIQCVTSEECPSKLKNTLVFN